MIIMTATLFGLVFPWITLKRRLGNWTHLGASQYAPGQKQKNPGRRKELRARAKGKVRETTGKGGPPNKILACLA